MNAKDFFEENKANVRELWNLSDSQKNTMYLLMEKYVNSKVLEIRNPIEKCINCEKEVEMVSNGCFCPKCYHEQ